MNPVTQEQQKSLDGFTVQRDNLIAEITELTRSRDSLRQQVSESTQAFTVLDKEISEHQQKLKTVAYETGSTLVELQSNIDTAKRELDNIIDAKHSASKELDVLITQLGIAKTSVNETLSSASSILNEIKNIRNEVNNSVQDIHNSAIEVGKSIEHIKQFSSEFHTILMEENNKNQDKRIALDLRETNLNHRENAINSTYSEILEYMGKHTIGLSDLNK